VINQGVIVQQGTPEELSSKEGLFKEMVTNE
jgi:ABC-type multidrug transport system fused ATPase/permease subunit